MAAFDTLFVKPDVKLFAAFDTLLVKPDVKLLAAFDTLDVKLFPILFNPEFNLSVTPDIPVFEFNPEPMLVKLFTPEVILFNPEFKLLVKLVPALLKLFPKLVNPEVFGK